MMHSVNCMPLLLDYAEATGKPVKDVNPKACAKWGFDQGYFDIGGDGDPENERDKIALVASDLKEVKEALS